MPVPVACAAIFHLPWGCDHDFSQVSSLLSLPGILLYHWHVRIPLEPCAEHITTLQIHLSSYQMESKHIDFEKERTRLRRRSKITTSSVIGASLLRLAVNISIPMLDGSRSPHRWRGTGANMAPPADKNREHLNVACFNVVYYCHRDVIWHFLSKLTHCRRRTPDSMVPLPIPEKPWAAIFHLTNIGYYTRLYQSPVLSRNRQGCSPLLLAA